MTLPVITFTALAWLVPGRDAADRRTGRAAFVPWAVCIVATLATVFALKVAFAARPGLGAWADLHSPSGHVVSAGLASGGLASRLVRDPRAGVLAAAAFMAAIGVTRLVLGVHSLADVVVGFAIGLAGAGRLAAVAARAPDPRTGANLALLAVCAAWAVALHGVRAPIEPWIDGLARALDRALP